MVRVRPGAGHSTIEATREADPTTASAATSAPVAPGAPIAPSTAADRTRLGATAASGSTITGLRRGVDPAILAPFSGPLRKALEAIALASPSPALSAALEAVSAHPQAQQIAVMALTGQRPDAVDSRAVRTFSGPTVAREAAVAALIGWHRQDAVSTALAGHHHALRRILEPALLGEPDAARWRSALATLSTLAESNAGSYRVASLLRGAGCLDARLDWRDEDLLPGSDAIAALATRDASDATAVDDAAQVTKMEARMVALFDSHKWAERGDLATHRGLLGEALRIDAVEASLSSPTQSVVQGILVLHAPDGLWNAPDIDAARDWARAHGISPSQLHRTVDAAGTSHWGQLRTEIDVAVFDRQPDGSLRALRFENVKAGVGSAKKAREQNAIAQEGWSHPSVRYLFPKDGGGYSTPRLDRSAAAVSGLRSLTVGPSDDPRYDAPLALSAHDITALSLRHP